jgi:seryl-tRNA synthetase
MAQREQAEKELIRRCAGGPRRCAKIPASSNEYPPHPMLDIQLLRKDLDGVAKRLADRGYTLDVAAFTALEAERRAVQTRTEELQARRNSL